MPEPSVPPRARRARTVWIVAVATVVAGLAWAFWPRPVEADLATVDRGEVTVELVDEGRTRMHDVYVIAAPVAGRLLRVEVEPGDPVAAGAVVARIARAPAGFLDTRTDLQARAQVDAAAAALRSAEASLALAQREHQRVQKLEAAKLVSVAAVDEARTRLDAARAARDAAQADLVRARSALQSPASATAGIVTVRAPSAGKVLRVPQKSEAVVAAGTPLVELGDDRHVEVVAEFLSQDAVRMAPGNEALIENWGGPALAAKVTRIEPVARTKVSALGVEEQRTNVILELAPAPALARLGHDYRVDARVIVSRTPDTVRAPLGALFRQGERWAVFRVVDGRAALTLVEVGDADAHFRAIRSGLGAGQQVIVFPGGGVVDGVRIVSRGTNDSR